MSSYHPIHDLWFLARAKLRGRRKYYGAYLGGFPERARVLLGVTLDDPVLHLCGGMARHYPYPRGFGEYDKTLDLDATTRPDFVQDAREPLPGYFDGEDTRPWPAILIDPPYSVEDAKNYAPGAENYPAPNLLVKNALDAVRVNGRVGIIHYLVPKPPKEARFVACVGIVCGFNNRMRAFSVFERTWR